MTDQKRPVSNPKSPMADLNNRTSDQQISASHWKSAVSSAKEPYKRDDILQKRPIITLKERCFIRKVALPGSLVCAMGWLRLVGSLKVKVSTAKEPYKRDDILQKRPMIISASHWKSAVSSEKWYFKDLHFVLPRMPISPVPCMTHSWLIRVWLVKWHHLLLVRLIRVWHIRVWLVKWVMLLPVRFIRVWHIRVWLVRWHLLLLVGLIRVWHIRVWLVRSRAPTSSTHSSVTHQVGLIRV